MSTAFQLSNGPITLPLDNKGEFIDYLILLCLKFAGKDGPILVRSSIGVLENVTFKIVCLLSTGAATLSFGSGCLGHTFLQVQQHLVIIPEGFYTALCVHKVQKA